MQLCAGVGLNVRAAPVPQALSAADLGVVTWLLTICPMEEILCDPPVLSQPVILSLIQQLAYDLTQDTELKLNWLHELALAFKAEDEVAKNHLSTIRQVVGHLAEHRDAICNLGPAVARVHRTLVQLIESKFLRGR